MKLVKKYGKNEKNVYCYQQSTSQSRSTGISDAILFVYKSADALKCISTPIAVIVLWHVSRFTIVI